MKPVVLVLAGSDPSGGAGIQADIEAIGSQGAHAAPVITSVTVQDTCNVLRIAPLPGELVQAQAQAVLDDLPVAAIKIGLLGSLEIVAAVAALLARAPGLPVVLDPVLAAGGGKELSEGGIRQAVIASLLPRATVLTPNSPEARRLSGCQALPEAAARLLALGCGHVLLTGTHEASPDVLNTLYSPGRPPCAWRWPRLAGEYHGSGCTLAAALAAGLALGHSLPRACAKAQAYTWGALEHGFRAGRGQSFPDRWWRFSPPGKTAGPFRRGK